MVKVLSIEEALSEIKAKKNAKGSIVVNRFNKKKFETLLLAMVNDISLTSENVKVKNGEIIVEKKPVTKEFRKFCRKLLEAAGVDKLESARIESDLFIIPSVEGLYEFFTEAMYLYMQEGNQFDFPSKHDFKASLRLVDVDETTKIYDSKDMDGNIIGKIEKKTKKHKKIKAKSNPPTYLSSKRKIK